MSGVEESSTIPHISDSEHHDNLEKLSQIKDGSIAETAELLKNIETIISMANKKQTEMAQAFEDKIDAMARKMGDLEKSIQTLLEKVNDDKI
uniref:Uncharacterized protein n=1 Tax=Parastrongyloides trichosuri TaxID=131310 RepID=A0A0N4ZH61_PARTI